MAWENLFQNPSEIKTHRLLKKRLLIPIVSFVAEKYNKQRRRETIQGGGNIMIFLNQIILSSNIIYSKTKINHL